MRSNPSRARPQIVSTFLADQPSPSLAPPPPSAACLAVAGPVERNAVSFTNRDWVIDGGALERRFGIGKVRLVNDFVANGYGLLTLDEAKECVTLQAAPKVAGAPMACVGAGTGLGECFSTASAEGSPYETFASEGGHSDWAPRTALEVELLGFLKDRFGQKHRVSVERVISGPGLATMYDFFSARFPDKVVAEVHAAVGAAGELKGKVIAQHSAPGAAPFCELCRLTMETFATAFGAEAASAALKWVPLGGLYIAGGMTPKNLRLLEGADSLFMRAFGDKGRLSPLLKRVPVYAARRRARDRTRRRRHRHRARTRRRARARRRARTRRPPRRASLAVRLRRPPAASRLAPVSQVLAEDIGQRGAHLVAFRMLRASAPSAAPSDIPAVQRFFHRLMLRSLPLSPPLAARSVVLVGDVGGTNTRLQLYAVEEGARVMDQQRAPGKLIHSAQYLNGDFGSFDQARRRRLSAAPPPALSPHCPCPPPRHH